MSGHRTVSVRVELEVTGDPNERAGLTMAQLREHLARAARAELARCVGVERVVHAATVLRRERP